MGKIEAALALFIKVRLRVVATWFVDQSQFVEVPRHGTGRNMRSGLNEVCPQQMQPRNWGVIK